MIRGQHGDMQIICVALAAFMSSFTSEFCSCNNTLKKALVSVIKINAKQAVKDEGILFHLLSNKKIWSIKSENAGCSLTCVWLVFPQVFCLSTTPKLNSWCTPSKPSSSSQSYQLSWWETFLEKPLNVSLITKHCSFKSACLMWRPLQVWNGSFSVVTGLQVPSIVQSGQRKNSGTSSSNASLT